MSDIDELLRVAVRSVAAPPPLAPWHELERRPLEPRRPRWVRRGLVLGVLALALAGALVFGGSTNGHGPSPLERASAAIGDWPPNRILHLRIVTTYNFSQADSLDESWQLTSPPYTLRHVSAFPSDASGAQRSEFVTDAGGSGQAFDWRTGEVAETTNLPAEWRQTGVAQTARAEIRAWLENIHATSLGESDIDGHHVIGYEAFGTMRIFLDAETYLPVLDSSFGLGVGAQRRGYDQHFIWELLPATPENRERLDLAVQHRGAAVVNLPESAWRSLEGQLGALIQPPITPGG